MRKRLETVVAGRKPQGHPSSLSFPHFKTRTNTILSDFSIFIRIWAPILPLLSSAMFPIRHLPRVHSTVRALQREVARVAAQRPSRRPPIKQQPSCPPSATHMASTLSAYSCPQLQLPRLQKTHSLNSYLFLELRNSSGVGHVSVCMCVLREALGANRKVKKIYVTLTSRHRTKPPCPHTVNFLLFKKRIYATYICSWISKPFRTLFISLSV